MTAPNIFAGATDRETVLLQLAGYASMCWSEAPTGVFQPGRAAYAVHEAIARLEEIS